MSTADKLNKILETKADIKLALIDKGLNPSDVFSTYADNIRAINGSIWTGHVDVEGLKAIGWDDEDIAYFQEHGVNWMEEDDEYYKVSEDNKALYGVLTVDNLQEYKNRIVWLPKFELSGSLYCKFKDFKMLKGTPILDCNKVTNMAQTFFGCYSLTCLCLLNTSNISAFNSAIRNCPHFMHINNIDTSKNGARDYMFYGDVNLIEGISINIGGTDDVRYIYTDCNDMIKCGDIDASNRDISTLFDACKALSQIKIKNLCSNLNLDSCSLFSKHSLLYAIEREASTSVITITLNPIAYARLAEDLDIVAALENHPLVSLASA